MTQPNLPSRLAMKAWTRRHPDWASTLDHHPGEFHFGYRALPRYAFDRARLTARKRIHGVARQPWITTDAQRLIETLLRPADHVVEFGTGGSTEWLAAQVASVIAVEAFDHWHAALAERLAQQGRRNVTLELVSAAEHGYRSDAHRAAYVGVCPEIESGTIDLVFVDGEYRDGCAMRGVDLLRPGGLLVLDNANTYLPTTTRAPWRVPAPTSIEWSKFLDVVADWRCIWTTNGAWDTALWIKP